MASGRKVGGRWAAKVGRAYAIYIPCVSKLIPDRENEIGNQNRVPYLLDDYAVCVCVVLYTVCAFQINILYSAFMCL